ncbi:MAG: hypothetical protein KJS79_03675 [Rhodospirillales bacterium]|nr:hypothetical protein [Rhodospirillales bacterium]
MIDFRFRLFAVHATGTQRDNLAATGLADHVDAFALFVVECDAGGRLIDSPVSGVLIGHRLISKDGLAIDWNALDDETARAYEKIEASHPRKQGVVTIGGDVARNGDAFMSDILALRLDPDDYSIAVRSGSDIVAPSAVLSAMKIDAWRIAVDRFCRLNDHRDQSAAIPMLDTEMAWRDFQRAQAISVIPTLPLFAGRGIFEPAAEDAPVFEPTP